MLNAENSVKAEEYVKQVHQLTRLFVLDASSHDWSVYKKMVGLQLFYTNLKYQRNHLFIQVWANT